MPPAMRTADFDFDLPEDRIALRPAARREDARMLRVGADGALTDGGVSDLPGLLRPNDVLVLNDSRVLRAALRGVRAARPEGGGGDVSVDANLLTKVEGATDTWRAFVRPARRLRPGDLIDFGQSRKTVGLVGLVVSREGPEAVLKLSSDADLDAALSGAGYMPLPPYIARRRAADADDDERYQTVYAGPEGSVAAPTAGLHLTEAMLAEAEDAGAHVARVTLHVGAGTFLPVDAEDTGDHVMHAEWGEVTEETARTLAQARAAGGRVVCVGTTSLRLLEAAARGTGEVQAFRGLTDIFITPGYECATCDVLVTNFHLPRSTLFMLVSAVAGTERMKAAYAHAVEAGYRFYSYGDACWLERAS